jgi:hypothetical protein
VFACGTKPLSSARFFVTLNDTIEADENVTRTFKIVQACAKGSALTKGS